MLDLYRTLFKQRRLIAFIVQTKFHGDVFKTLFGHVWYFLLPLSQIFIYFFLVFVVFQHGGDPKESFLLIMMGVTHYFFFQQAIGASCDSILGNESLIMQVKVEPAIFCAAFFTRSLRNFIISLLIVLGFFFCLGMKFGSQIAFYPFILALFFFVTWQICLLTASLTVFFRDLKQICEIGLRILIYTAPVIYSIQLIPSEWRKLYLMNPFASLFALLQWSLLGGEFPGMEAVMCAVIFAALAAGLAQYVYRSCSPKFTKAF